VAGSDRSDQGLKELPDGILREAVPTRLDPSCGPEPPLTDRRLVGTRRCWSIPIVAYQLGEFSRGDARNLRLMTTSMWRGALWSHHSVSRTFGPRFVFRSCTWPPRHGSWRPLPDAAYGPSSRRPLVHLTRVLALAAAPRSGFG